MNLPTLMSFQKAIYFLILVAASVYSTPCLAQVVDNGEFNQNLDGWFAFGSGSIELTDDANQGPFACLVTNRSIFWNGVAQSLDVTQLEPGADYHIQARVKLPAEQSGIMGIILYQNDDRGERALRLGEIAVGPDEWTLLEGAFTYDPHGDINYMFLNFDTSGDDGGNYDFQLDSVTITKNNWRQAADDRIEQIRKRDARINFVRRNNKPEEGIEVEAVQLSHSFAFGSALNPAVLSNPEYEQFFKTHFDWATLEWQCQWHVVEEDRGVENYFFADETLNFCEENGIQAKGHALFWGQESTRPAWLDDLSDSQLEAALEERISSAVNRFGSRVYGWDVNNEMLHHRYFADRLGDSIRTWMYTRARELNPDIDLFLNEFDLTISGARADRYRELYDSLTNDGAEIAGVGFQSHFDGRMSPKGLELGLRRFEDTDARIWFTEYDTGHPDPQQRANSLEDFYRYAFSRPEAEGIIMWGFWAGTHWRGPEASIVDLDWTVNAAGEKYFALMDEWTTEAEGSSDPSGQFEFRGFHGSYLVKTTDESGVVNYHLIPLEKQNTKGEPVASDFTATVTPFDQSLTLHGTDGDDLFEIDLSVPGRVVLNGITISYESIVGINTSRIQLASQGGQDRVVIKTNSDSTEYHVNGTRLIDRTTRQEIQFGDIATVAVNAVNPESRVIMVDTAGDDVLASFPQISVFTTADREISLSDFETVIANSNLGFDQAFVFDSVGVDQISTDLNEVEISDGESTRSFGGYSEFEFDSTSGLDQLVLQVPDGEEMIEISPDSIEVLVEMPIEPAFQERFRFLNVPSAAFFTSEGTAHHVEITGNDQDESVRISINRCIYCGDDFDYVFSRNFRSFASLAESGGRDRLIFRDTTGNESLVVNGSSIEISGDRGSHSFDNLDSAALFSQAGGEDSATLTDPDAVVRLTGDWNVAP